MGLFGSLMLWWAFKLLVFVGVGLTVIVAAFSWSAWAGVVSLVLLVVWLVWLARPKHGDVLGSARRLAKLGVAFTVDGRPDGYKAAKARAVAFTTDKYGAAVADKFDRRLEGRSVGKRLGRAGRAVADRARRD